MFKSVFIKKFKIIFICFCFIQNKCYSEDCCEICYNCCCNCLNSKDKETSVCDNTNKEKSHTYKNKKLEKNSEKEEEEEENNENEENEGKEEEEDLELIYKYKNQANKGNNKLNTIIEKKEEEEEEEEENGSNEKEKNDEINNDKYLEEVLENFNNVKVIEGDFFKAQNNYELEKNGTEKNDGVLGEGTYGCVYKIKKDNEKIFALKEIVVKDHNIVKDIQKEIQNLIRLKDKQNILRIVDVYRQDNFIGNFLGNEYSKEKNATCFYIITEYCEGGDLFYLIINEGGKYDKNKIAYQIINAVYVCHQKQIAHLDLKPENFFLSDNLNIKLGDFGVSYYFEGKAKYDKKCGSIGYISYEVFLGKEYDPIKADLFSLGATLYALYIKESLYYIEENELIKKIDDEFNEIPKKIDSIQDINLKTLLKGLLTKLEKDRCGWDDILASGFYKELQKKYKGN